MLRRTGRQSTEYRVLELIGPGSTANFRMATRSLPAQLPTGSVLVKVRACAVAYRDVLDRQGAFKFIKRPTVLGHEFAGTVEKTHDVTGFAAGSHVVSLHWDQTKAWPSPLVPEGAVPSMFGLMCDGGYGEYVVAPEGALVAAPVGHMTPAQSACVMSTFGTVWCGAVVRGGLQPAMKVLVTGASGGVGSAAVQLCRAYGCDVTGVTSNAAKSEFVRHLGCENVIVASDDGKFKLPAGTKAFDVVIEAVGGPTFASSLRAVAPGGKVVLVGNVTNATVQLPLGYCILNSITIVGSDSIAAADFTNGLVPFLAKHKLQPVVDTVLPWQTGAVEAHAFLESRTAKGRFVLDISDATKPW